MKTRNKIYVLWVKEDDPKPVKVFLEFLEATNQKDYLKINGIESWITEVFASPWE